jgi:hypothetical protein
MDNSRMSLQTPIMVPGRGLDGFFSVAKHAMTTLINLMTAIVTQSPNVIHKLTPSKIKEIGRRSYLDTTIKRAEEQPQQMFKTPIQAINVANEEPVVVSARQAASAFEMVTSHNVILLIVIACILVYLLYTHSNVLFLNNINMGGSITKPVGTG